MAAVPDDVGRLVPRDRRAHVDSFPMPLAAASIARRTTAGSAFSCLREVRSCRSPTPAGVLRGFGVTTPRESMDGTNARGELAETAVRAR